jgi:hypothetical protein
MLVGRFPNPSEHGWVRREFIRDSFRSSFSNQELDNLEPTVPALNVFFIDTMMCHLRAVTSIFCAASKITFDVNISDSYFLKEKNHQSWRSM